jgi:hypothetical protein
MLNVWLKKSIFSFYLGFSLNKYKRRLIEKKKYGIWMKQFDNILRNCFVKMWNH